MDDRGHGDALPEPRMRLVGSSLTPEQKRLRRLQMEDAVRERFLRGERKNAIARELGVPLGFVTATLKRFDKELERARVPEAALYRQRLVEQLERLKARCYAALDRSEEERKKTRQEQLKASDGSLAGSRLIVDKSPGEFDARIAAVILGIELKLGALHGVGEASAPAPSVVEREFYYVSPSRPIDLDRLAQLNRVIDARVVSHSEPAQLGAGGNGNGNGNGHA